MASKAHRVAKGLVGGCALLLGVALSGCAAPQYTYVANSGANTYFKVPYGWHKISDSSLSSELRTATGSSGGGWTVAYEAGGKPTAGDFLSFGTSQPFVFAEVGQLNSTASNSLSYDTLRDFFLPVTSTARQNVAAEGSAHRFQADPRPDAHARPGRARGPGNLQYSYRRHHRHLR